MRSLGLIDFLRDAGKHVTVGTPERRTSQHGLAREMTARVHGRDAASNAEVASKILFGGDAAAAEHRVFEALAKEIPTLRLSRASFEDGADASDLPARTGLVKSKSEGRRRIEQGGVYVNGRKLEPLCAIAADSLLHGSYVLLRRGKQNYALVVAE